MEAVPREKHSHGAHIGVRMKQLGAFGGCAHVGVSSEELAPSKESYPAHYHMLEEEHVLVIVCTDSGRVGVRFVGGGYRKAATMA